MIKGSGQNTAHSGSRRPFAFFPPYTLAEESVLTEPDGSQMTPQASEDMNWLEQFPRPQSSPGTELSGLDLDGHKIKQVSRSPCQQSGKSRLAEQTGWGPVMGVRENCGAGEKGRWHRQLKGSSSSPQMFNIGGPQGSVLGLLFSVYTHFLSAIIQTHGFEDHRYRDNSRFSISSLTSSLNT